MSDLGKLNNAIAASKRLAESIRGDLLGVRQAVKGSRPGIVGPIAGSHAAEEASAYLAQIENHMVKAQEASHALTMRLERMASQARGL